ncbi:uncharacterized protein B0I36DRAFT_150437 [Microdochium trichocladiopsis]|uniref:Uncharacterized protein n=1 Tax=Microdochium trichocladiopsis TaxID=1682393 RepID=A0A9P8XYA5_9PEZI|nr:uncharacterized protein B0I36DRAFT_150437 [Microdochium trichocladiopsis]KAH7025890.1 hypothetical protein B0I36DRAFT_150437 [Microdochium trichocladiopsis]
MLIIASNGAINVQESPTQISERRRNVKSTFSNKPIATPSAFAAAPLPCPTGTITNNALQTKDPNSDLKCPRGGGARPRVDEEPFALRLLDADREWVDAFKAGGDRVSSSSMTCSPASSLELVDDVLVRSDEVECWCSRSRAPTRESPASSSSACISSCAWAASSAPSRSSAWESVLNG